MTTENPKDENQPQERRSLPFSCSLAQDNSVLLTRIKHLSSKKVRMNL